MKNSATLGANEILDVIFIYLTEVSTLKNYDDIMFVLANMGRALTSSERCSIWIVSDDKQTIWTKVAHGMDAIEMPVGSGIVGRAISEGKKVIIDNVYKDESFNQEIDKKTGFHTKSMMVIPMFDNEDEIIGAFQVMNRKGDNGTFDKRDMERLMLASTYAAETLISAKLYLEIENTQKEVVFTMGAIGESRSKETGNHVKRVAEYSKLLALAYGLSMKEAELLKQASPMHDIGKVAIPDAILNKSGKFTANERKIMDTHAELGYSMTKNSDRPLLQAASIVAYEHHEKWDGSGYPRALKGEEIHIYGRITAISDVFDALGSDRVYKQAWSDNQIFELFKKEKGKHFDPKLIDLFFENLVEILKIRDNFKDLYVEKETPHQANTNHIKILGAYGSNSRGFGTSSFYLNAKNVIDAGNLLNTMEEACASIENIWLTHSHLDHITDIAYILDNYYSSRDKSLNIIALPATITAIKKHFLNDIIWPDFSKIKLHNSDAMSVTYTEIKLGLEYSIGENEFIKAVQTDHTVPSCGYVYRKNKNSVIISADTYSLTNILQEIEDNQTITAAIIECSFTSNMQKLAKESKHMTPKILFEELKNLKRDEIKLYINHMKPIFLEKIKEEISQNRANYEIVVLKDEDFINF